MRGFAAPAFAVALTIALAGCGAANHAAAPTVTKTIIVTSPATSPSSPAVTNSASATTRVSVKGEPIAGRIATGPDATSGGLTISGVTAYRLTAQNVVVVAFKLTDSSYRPINTSPSLLASLNGASDAVSQDALPAFLAPGDKLYAAAAFDITQTTGQFCLQPNGQSASLPCTTLRKI